MYEITFALIKPDAVRKGYAGQIITEMEREFFVADVVCTHWSQGAVAQFYAEHEGKPFFEDLIKFMCSGRMYAISLVGANAIEKWRTMMGPTDPKAAPPESIRGMFGSKDGPIMHNAVHGSASRKDVLREMDIVRFAMARSAGYPVMGRFGDEAVKIDKSGSDIYEMR